MFELKIDLCDKLKTFLDRYYSNDTLENRFYLALSENLIEMRGKSFYLTIQMSKKFEEILKEDEKRRIDSSFNNDSYDQMI